MIGSKKLAGKLNVLAVAVLAGTLILGACSKDQPAKVDNNKQVTITFWHTYNQQEQPTIQELVNEFEKKNPKIKIDIKAVPFADAQNKFTTAVEGGNAPDVMRADVGWTPSFAALGLVAAIDDLIKAEDKADYMPGPMAYNQFQGKTYGVPQTTDVLGLLYNKRMLKEAGVEPPKTMDELLAAAQKLTNKDKGQYGIYLRGSEAYYLQPFILSFGGNLIDADRSIKINSSESVAGLQFVLDLKNKYAVTPREIDFAGDYQNAIEGFKAGKYAMIINGPWATADILSGAEFKDANNFGVFPIPSGPDGKSGSPLGGHNYVISANSKNREIAYQFIEFINSKDAQAKLNAKNNLMPTHKSAYELQSVKGNRISSEFKAVLERGTNRPVIPEMGQIYTVFDTNYQAAFAGEKTARQALDDVAADWLRILNK
jgi:arabinogalactan oligomer/maltooligosaccharide transport system substrate-binding protein